MNQEQRDRLNGERESDLDQDHCVEGAKHPVDAGFSETKTSESEEQEIVQQSLAGGA